MPTRDALRLPWLIADSRERVNIFTDAYRCEARYRVRGGRGRCCDAAAGCWRRSFKLTAGAATPHGVTLAGEVPGPQAIWRVFEMTYEIHVPRPLRSGKSFRRWRETLWRKTLMAAWQLSTGGGDIRIGRVGGDLGHCPSGSGTAWERRACRAPTNRRRPYCGRGCWRRAVRP